MLAITHVVALPLQPAMVAVTTRSVAGSTSSVAGALTLKQGDVRATGVTRTVDVQRSRKVCNWNPLSILCRSLMRIEVSNKCQKPLSKLMLAITHVVALPLQPAMVAVMTRSVAGSTSSVAGALTLEQGDVRATGVTRTVDVQRSRKVCNWNPLSILCRSLMRIEV